MLETLLVFVGIPLLVMAVISLLVMAPSLAKGSRFRPGQAWDAHPEWFGAPEPTGAEAAPQRPELEGGPPATGALAAPPSSRATGDDRDTGGASVRW